MASKIPLIHGVHVQSGAFSDGHDITLFADRTPARRTSIIFGHNGSGKSTIAREIEGIRAGNSSGFTTQLIKNWIWMIRTVHE